jgi:hypothetical protein
MKFCTKTQDLLKAYNKATNEMLVELLERSGYQAIMFTKFSNRYPTECESDEGTEFQAADDYDCERMITGHWVGEDIGGILVINEEWFIKPEVLKQAVELKTTNLEDVFDYYDYEYEETVKQQPVLTFTNWYKLKDQLCK